MNLTPTQQRFYDLLADGFQHSLDELILLLDDEFNEDPRLCTLVHICNMRKRLAAHGLDVIVRGANGQSTARMVRFISSGE